jgi:hypothetical protein
MEELASRLNGMEARLRSLERQNRVLRTGMALGAVCVAASIAMAAAAPRTLSGGSLVLTDASGNKRVKLDATGLLFLSPNGKTLASFWANPKSGAGLVFFDGQHSNGRLGIGMWGKDAGIGMEDASAKEAAWLGQEPFGTSLQLFDAASKKRLTAEAGTMTSDFNVFAPNGKNRAQLYTDSDTAGVDVRDASGLARLHGYVDSSAHFKLLDSSNSTIWSAP